MDGSRSGGSEAGRGETSGFVLVWSGSHEVNGGTRGDKDRHRREFRRGEGQAPKVTTKNESSLGFVWKTVESRRFGSRSFVIVVRHYMSTIIILRRSVGQGSGQPWHRARLSAKPHRV